MFVSADSIIKVRFVEKNFDLTYNGKYPSTLDDFEQLLAEINLINVCDGGPSATHYKNVHPRCAVREHLHWRHNNCPIIVKLGKICKQCRSLDEVLRQNLSYQMKIKTNHVKLPTTLSTKRKVKCITNRFKFTKERPHRK